MTAIYNVKNSVDKFCAIKKKTIDTSLHLPWQTAPKASKMIQIIFENPQDVIRDEDGAFITNVCNDLYNDNRHRC